MAANPEMRAKQGDLLPATQKPCRHAGQKRSLVDHYDVACDECGQIIGRVALTPSAVLDPAESKWLLKRLDDDGESRPPAAISKLRYAAEA